MSLLTRSSTNQDIIDAYIGGANYYDISDATALTVEDVKAIIETADDAGKLAVSPVAPITIQGEIDAIQFDEATQGTLNDPVAAPEIAAQAPAFAAEPGTPVAAEVAPVEPVADVVSTPVVPQA
jgi:hypothetical protein